MGYNRFELNDVQISTESTRMRIPHLETYTPALLLIKSRWRDDSQPFLVLDRLEISVRTKIKDDQENHASSIDGVNSLMYRMPSWRQSIDRWLPWIKMEMLTVERHGRDYQFSDLQWRHGRLYGVIERLASEYLSGIRAELVFPDVSQPASIRLDYGGNEDFLTSTFLVEEGRGISGEISGSFEHHELRGQVQWKQTGWMPTNANLDADLMVIPLRKWWSHSPVDTLAGRINGKWDGVFYFLSGELKLEASDNPDSALFQGATLSVTAQGNDSELKIAHLDFKASIGNLEITQPVVYHFENHALIGSANAGIDLELSRLGIRDLDGSLKGSLNLLPGDALMDSEIHFDLDGTDVAYQGFSGNDLKLSGSTNLKLITVSSLEVHTDEDGWIKASFTFDIDTKSFLEGKLDAKVPIGFVGPRLPEFIEFQKASVDLSVSGPISGLSYEGKLDLETLKIRGLQPLDVEVGISGDFNEVNLKQLKVRSPFVGN